MLAALLQCLLLQVVGARTAGWRRQVCLPCTTEDSAAIASAPRHNKKGKKKLNEKHNTLCNSLAVWRLWCHDACPSIAATQGDMSPVRGNALSSRMFMACSCLVHLRRCANQGDAQSASGLARGGRAWPCAVGRGFGHAVASTAKLMRLVRYQNGI